jgi:hypothetical protein
MAVLQDIIDDIIGRLHDDIYSLRACATVCRSFLSPSRRGIFSSIKLHKRLLIWRFYRLLSRNPDIAFFVLDLDIVLDPQSTALPIVLGTLSRLRRLTVGCQRCAPRFCWDMVPNDQIIALGNLLRSPSLYTLTIFNISLLPASIIAVASSVKTLMLTYVSLDYQTSNPFDTETPIVPMQLKTVCLLTDLTMPRWLFPRMPLLRQLVIKEASTGFGPSGADQFLKVGKKCIEDVVWLEYRDHKSCASLPLLTLAL